MCKYNCKWNNQYESNLCAIITCMHYPSIYDVCMLLVVSLKQSFFVDSVFII